jgi:hypothetical protein
LFDTLGDKAGDIVGQIDTVALRLAQLLDEKNLRNLSRTLDNLANASDGLREMPAILASMREALSASNLRSLRQSPRPCRKDRRRNRAARHGDARTGEDHGRPGARVDQLAGSTGEQLATRYPAACECADG